MEHNAEISAILKQVEDWSAEEKRALAAKLNELAMPAATTKPRGQHKRPSLSELLGIANPSGRSFTDEEIDDLRHAALKEKYNL